MSKPEELAPSTKQVVNVPAKAEEFKYYGGPISSYSEEIAEKICMQIVDGMTLRAICEQEGMPSTGTVFRWLGRNEEFYAMYYTARQLAAERMADELVEIADDSRNDFMEKETESGRVIQVVDHEHIQRTRLRIDTRKFLLAKLNPKIYGERVNMMHSGGVTAQLIIMDGDSK